MKIIVFFLIISLAYNIIHISKYGSHKFHNITDSFYLNANEFDKNSKIHIQMNSYNGYVDQEIRYDFTDDDPSDSFIPTRKKKPASSASTSTKVNGKVKKFTEKYYYEIKKDVSKKYLIVRYFGYRKEISGSYLEIINTYINWGKLWTALFILAFAIPFSIIGGCLFYHKCYKKKCRKNQSDLEPKTPNDYKPPNYSSDNPDFNSKNTYENEYKEAPQTDNIYYEPTNRAYDTHDDTYRIN